MDELSLERVLEYFDYDRSSGHLIAKLRDRSEFGNKTSFLRHTRRVGRPAGSINGSGYRHVLIDGTKYKAHRVVWLIETGECLDGSIFQIDHINGIRDDNRICNLRRVTQSENQRNAARRIDNKSGVAGVIWLPQVRKWDVRIRKNGRRVCVGSFENFEDAVRARKVAEEENGYISNGRPPSEYSQRRVKKDVPEGSVPRIRETV